VSGVRRPVSVRVAVRGSLACAIALAVLLGAGPTRADDSAVIGSALASLGSGEEVYQHICQGCHMANGQGAVGAGHYPKLARNPTLASWRYVAITVLDGRNGMPSFGAPGEEGKARFATNLTDAQIAAVVNYVRNNFGNTWKSRVTAGDVEALPHPGSATPLD
jgi:mono/diheme cytochrome c family protein